MLTFEYIESLIKQATAWVQEISGGNEFLAGGLAIWFIGTGSYLLKSVPGRLWNFTKRKLTTSITLSNHDACFYNLLAWLNKTGYANKIRHIKVSNGKYGEDKTLKSIGYGTHIIWINWVPYRFVYSKENETHSELTREFLEITKLGRSHKFFDRLISDVMNVMDEDSKYYRVYKYQYSSWHRAAKQPKRSFSSVFINQETIRRLTKRIEDFLSKEQWYIEHGIPYQLGILLYGPPGTGKTSLIKAIASQFNKDIYLSVGMLGSIESMVSGLNENSMLVIEDIDSQPETHDREEEGADKKEKANLSTLLNALDGVNQIHGRILVATTNHLEHLDKALIRPGRIDLVLEVGYLDKESFYNFIKKFYPDAPCNFELRVHNITGAMLQNEILQETPLEEIYRKYTRNEQDTIPMRPKVNKSSQMVAR